MTRQETLKITGVTIDGSGNAKVLWSWNESGGKPYVEGSAVTLPEDMKKANSFLVRSELSVQHTMLLFFGSPAGSEASTRTITINREFYYRQRLGNDVPCSDCGWIDRHSADAGLQMARCCASGALVR